MVIVIMNTFSVPLKSMVGIIFLMRYYTQDYQNVMLNELKSDSLKNGKHSKMLTVIILNLEVTPPKLFLNRLDIRLVKRYWDMIVQNSQGARLAKPKKGSLVT